ncbi:hypothetical protein P9112_004675 [Eukaryota sp. TZLM1-RC]
MEFNTDFNDIEGLEFEEINEDDISDSELLDELKEMGWEEPEADTTSEPQKPSNDDVPSSSQSKPTVQQQQHRPPQPSSPQQDCNTSTQENEVAEQKPNTKPSTLFQNEIALFESLVHDNQRQAVAHKQAHDKQAALQSMQTVKLLQTVVHLLKEENLASAKEVISQLKSMGVSLKPKDHDTTSPVNDQGDDSQIQKERPKDNIEKNKEERVKSPAVSPQVAQKPQTLLDQARDYGKRQNFAAARRAFDQYQKDQKIAFLTEIGDQEGLDNLEKDALNQTQLDNQLDNQLNDQSSTSSSSEFSKKLETVLNRNKELLKFSQTVGVSDLVSQFTDRVNRLERTKELVQRTIEINEKLPNLKFITQEVNLPDVDSSIGIDKIKITVSKFDGVSLRKDDTVKISAEFADCVFANSSCSVSHTDVFSKISRSSVTLVLTTNTNPKELEKFKKQLKNSRNGPKILFSIHSLKKNLFTKKEQLLFTSTLSLKPLASQRCHSIASPLVPPNAPRNYHSRKSVEVPKMLIEVETRSAFVEITTKSVTIQDCVPSSSISPSATESIKVAQVAPTAKKEVKKEEVEQEVEENNEDIYDTNLIASFDVLNWEIEQTTAQLGKNPGDEDLQLRLSRLQLKAAVLNKQAEEGQITEESYAELVKKAIGFEIARAKRLLSAKRKPEAGIVFERIKIMKQELANA